MSYTSRISWETLRTRDSSTMISSSTYYTVGGPLLYPSYILKLVNNSTVLVTLSIDGAIDVDVVPSGSFWLYDEGKVGQSSNFPAVAAGTQIYVKSATAGTGSIYLVSQFIVQG